MKLALTEPQEEFVFNQASFPALVAGLGSGKSFGGIARLVVKMVTTPGINTAYYLPTYDLLRLRILPGFEEMLSNLGLPYTTNRSEYIINLRGYGNIILRSFDRPERIIAYETGHSCVDELDTLPLDKAELVWRKITERNRQKYPGVKNTIAVATTPDQGYSGFIYKKWVKMKQPGYELIQASTNSNPFLPDDYIEQIKANYDPILADMYINGSFVSLSQNKVYHFFDRKKHHSSRSIKETDRNINVGLDFNIGGCCATTWVIENNIPIAVDEFVSHDTQDFCNNLSRYKDKNVVVFPDASGKAKKTNASQSDIDIIRQRGYRVDAPISNPAVRDRINCFNALFAHDKIKINTDACPNLTDALESQGYDKKGEPEKFDKHPAIDDHVDSAGYFIHRKFPLVRPSTQIQIGGML